MHPALHNYLGRGFRLRPPHSSQTRPPMISGITESPRETGLYGVFLVISAVDETPPGSRAFGAFRPFAPKETSSPGIVGCCVLLTFATQAEQHCCDQETREGSPFETKGVFANTGSVAVRPEVITSKNVSRSVDGLACSR